MIRNGKMYEEKVSSIEIWSNCFLLLTDNFMSHKGLLHVTFFNTFLLFPLLSSVHYSHCHHWYNTLKVERTRTRVNKRYVKTKTLISRPFNVLYLFFSGSYFGYTLLQSVALYVERRWLLHRIYVHWCTLVPCYFYQWWSWRNVCSILRKYLDNKLFYIKLYLITE